MPITQTFAPDLTLARDVQCFWAFEHTQAEVQHGPILPDAHVELIFNCGAPQFVEMPDGTAVEMPTVALNGLQSRPFQSRIKGDCQLFAVRLNAWAMRYFVDLPDNFCEQPAIALGGIWKDIARTVVAAVCRGGYQEAVACVQQFILDIRRPAQPALIPIRVAGELLDSTYGNVRLNDLADRSGLSPRQFERQFKYSTGISPKTYARLIRHETARITLSRNPRINMVSLAQELGYSDQAHFIHDFKTFTSYTPGQYAAQIKLTYVQEESSNTLSPQQAGAYYGFSS